jgi:hypothetical protein
MMSIVSPAAIARDAEDILLALIGIDTSVVGLMEMESGDRCQDNDDGGGIERGPDAIRAHSGTVRIVTDTQPTSVAGARLCNPPRSFC